jgi:hypothetical protein
MSDPREGNEFFLSVPAKLDDPFPDLAYFREHRPIFYYPPLQSWFVFRFDDVSALFHDARLSARPYEGIGRCGSGGGAGAAEANIPAFRDVGLDEGRTRAHATTFLRISWVCRRRTVPRSSGDR